MTTEPKTETYTSETLFEIKDADQHVKVNLGRYVIGKAGPLDYPEFVEGSESIVFIDSAKGEMVSLSLADFRRALKAIQQAID